MIGVYSIGLCMQDYNSLNVTVMICATLVNTQTDSFWPVILLAQLASCAKNWTPAAFINNLSKSSTMQVNFATNNNGIIFAQ